MATLADPRHRPRRLRRELADAAAHRRAGVRRAGARSSRRWPTPSRRSAATSRRSRTSSPSRPSTLDAATESLRVQRPFLDRPRPRSRGLLGRDRGAAGRAAAAQRRDRRRHAVQKRAVDAQRRARPRRSTSVRDLAEAPGHERGAARADRDGHHAQPAAALLRPVRDGLQLLELLLDVPRRALLRARQHRPRPARARQHGRPPGGQLGLDGRRRARQRRGRARGQRRSTRRASRTAPPSAPTAAPTARPASAASSSAQARFLPGRSTRSPATRARPASRARPSPAARACPTGQTFTRRARDGPVRRHAGVRAPMSAALDTSIGHRRRWRS